jgi:tetratricopeptide (TPR) repeat protein
MELLDFINEKIEKPIGLISGYVFLVTSIFVSLKALFPNAPKVIDLVLYISVLLVWTIIWIIARNKLPRNKKGDIGIIISISTENDKQKVRLKNDFIKRLNEQAKANGIDSLIKFIQIPSNKSIKINDILTEFSTTNRLKRTQLKEGEKSVIAFNKLKRKIRGHFFVWGQIKERMDIENKYYLDLDGLVLHSPLNDPIHARLFTEFNTVWTKSINFYEKFEFKGFLLSADFIFIAVEYVVGLAALFSGDAELAATLHSKLENSINKMDEKIPNLKHIQKSLSLLIPVEYNLSAVIQLNKGNSKKSEEYLQRSLKRLPDNYSALITMSIIQFTVQHDPNNALISVRKARKCSGNDGTWRYNEAFLLMYLDKFEEAFNLYREIVRFNFPNEDGVLSEILEFNKKMIKQDPKYFQSYFILGFLYYKKIINYPEAFHYLDQFQNLCKDPKYKFLLKIASTYLEDLNLRMNLK